MAFPTPVNTQITDAVTQANVKGRGDTRQTPAPAADSSRFPLVLSLIDGGAAWLAWADSVGIVPTGRSEAELLLMIQQGVHASPLVMLPGAGLLVHPRKLLQISVEDLNTIAQTKTGLDASLLAKYDLFDAAGLDAGSSLLSKLGVTASYDQSLAERIALARLAVATLAPPLSDSIGAEAAAWAQQQAVTAGEFADLVVFYLAHAEQGETKSARAAAVKATMTALQPLVLPLLQCPLVDDLDVEVLLADLRRQLRMGASLGFRTPADAYRILALAGGVIAQSGSALQSAVDAFMARAHAPVIEVQPGPATASQDGRWSLLTFKSKDCVTLAIDASGLVVVEDFTSGD